MLKLKGLVCCMMTITIGAGCTGTKEPMNEKTEGDKPVTLTMYQKTAGITDEEFQEYFVKPVQQKFPQVKLEMVRASTQGNTEQELMVSGTFPDLIYSSNPGIANFKTLGLVDDLTDTIKKNGLDLNVYDPKAIDSIKQNGEAGQLYALPFSQNFGALIYNKDLFDKFAVPYPTDGMSWEQLLELSKKLTRNQDGVQYIGLDPYAVNLIGSGLSLPFVDPKTNKAMLNNDGWRKVFDLYKQLFAIPGYVDNEKSKYQYGVNGFFKDKNVAMFTPWFDTVVGQAGAIQDMKWDLAALPNFKEAVGTGREFDVHVIMVSNMSKHKELAAQIMQLVTTSEEVQAKMTKRGRMTVLNKPEMQKLFAQDIEALKGKQIASVFKSKPGLAHVPTVYDSIASQKLNAALKDVALGNKDVNTVIRETEEVTNLAIEAAKGK
ncbi:ABC transporter substrate-binding protein [Paenibacillus sp. NPDC056579]|uniref:ABC transporter substrate-binding protein n=1 Tax=Paenibacillus sp. NPDC056579 TaxID=3345871 RepID=UPI00369F65E2